MLRFWFALTFIVLSAGRVLAASLDLSEAVVVAPVEASTVERTAARMLIEEVAKRTQITWKSAEQVPDGPTPVIALVTSDRAGHLPKRAADALAGLEATEAADGYRVLVAGGDAPIVLLVGNDERGTLFAAGRLLRELQMSHGKVSVDDALSISTAPETLLRGHQLGYRPKTNSYDAWDVAIWEQYIRDLAVFGTNAIELVPPRTDDDLTSPLMPLPPLQMMTEMSRICDNYGLDVWIWFPAIAGDYNDPAIVEASLKEWDEVFAALPRVDAVFVPGGDPGHTHPSVLMPFLAKQTENLHKHHPDAEMWVAPQGFNAEWMQVFLEILNNDQAEWLDGVVYGPQVRLPLPELRKVIPQKYPIRWYPDITHSRQCQYPVPNWDLAYAVTEGREGINPRPLGHAHLYRTLTHHTCGFLTYSEGCNDDVNKFVWSSLGWDSETPVLEILRDYSKYFIGDDYADPFAQGLLALERNWDGALIDNFGVDVTLLQFQTLERAASPEVLGNWRFQQALYRAYYDSYLRDRVLYETSFDNVALAQLLTAPEVGSLKALDQAEKTLDDAVIKPAGVEKRQRVFEIGDALNQSIRMQLSVERHKAIAAERGANLDTIDNPVSNRLWLKHRFSEIRTLPEEEARLSEIEALVHWKDPGPGGFYDDLGHPSQQPHLVRGPGFEGDPEFFSSPRTGYLIAREAFDQLPLSWLQNAEILYDGPIRMQYEGLDPDAKYRLKVSYAGDSMKALLTLLADEQYEVHRDLLKGLPQLREFEIPVEATRDGSLTLTWRCEPGRGGNGRGCQIAEVWLIREPSGN